MKTKSLLFVVMIVLLSSFSLAALNDSSVYWALDVLGTTAIDSSGHNNGTITGTTNVTGVLGSARQKSGGTDRIVSNAKLTLGNEWSWSMALYPTTSTGAPTFISGRDDAGTKYGFTCDITTSRTIHCYIRNGAAWSEITSTGTVSLNSWHQVGLRMNGTTYTFIINGTAAGTATTSINMDALLYFVGCNGYSTEINGGIVGRCDEIALYNRSLTDAEFAQLFNSGSFYNPFASAPTPPASPSISWVEPSEVHNTSIFLSQNRPVIFTANASNIANLTTYMCFEHVRPGGGSGSSCKAANLTSATYNSTIPFADQYNFTANLYNGTYPSGVLLASTSVRTVYIYNAEAGNLSALSNWSKSARINMTAGAYTPSQLPASLLQVQNYTLVLYNGTTLVKTIYNGTFVSNVTYNYYPDNLTVGNYTLKYTTTYNDTFNNQLRTFIASQNVSILSDASLNITLKNALNSSILANATINVTDLTSSTKIVYTTTNGNIEAYILKGRNYTIDVDAAGYAITQQNYTANTSQEQYLNVSVYTENSVYVNIFDEATNIRITGTNISIVFTGTIEQALSTTTGALYADGLLDGAYTVKLSGGNYTLKTYSITVNNRSTQVLNAYLNSNVMTTIFQVLDQDTGENVYDASFLMERLINTTYVVVDSKSTDITGRVQVSYLPNVKYRFTIAKTGYVSQVFYLDPIIFSTYTVRLDSVGGGSTGQDFNDVSIIYYPRTFWNGKLNNFTWSASSPAGVLINYTLNITYPGGTQARTGVNANGQTFNLNFTLANVSFYDKINVTYTYTSTVGGTKQFSASYDILGANVSSNSSIVNIMEKDYGLGWFEKVFITTLVAIVIAGFVYSMAGMGGALFTALMVFGIAGFIGFMPWWSVLITILVGFAVMTADAKSGGGQ